MRTGDDCTRLGWKNGVRRVVHHFIGSDQFRCVQYARIVVCICPSQFALPEKTIYETPSNCRTRVSAPRHPKRQP
jgi:hypothetical protein